MATGRIGVTPTLGTRWSKAPAGGTTSLSGLDDNSVSLVYSVGYEAVYRNGVLLSRGNDYTATDGTTITLIDATIAGDIIEVFANQLVPLSDAISKGQFTAKGSLLSATAASTPAVLAVGSNNQVLTADSSTSTGLKWATPASGVTNWTTRLQGVNSNLRCIAYNGSNLYVAAGPGGALYSSADGFTWTSRTSGFGSNDINKIIFANSIWVAVGQNGTITTSSDGISWTARTSNMGSNAIFDIFYGNSLFVAVGNGGGATNNGGIIYSSDGVTWTRKSQTVTVGTIYNSVTYNGTNWIVGATLNTNNYLYASTPSGTWTAGVFGGGAVSAAITGLWYDGTRIIWIADGVSSFGYSTSATAGNAFYYDNCLVGNTARTTTLAKNYYYNGRMYVFGVGNYNFSTTPSSNATNLSSNLSSWSGHPYLTFTTSLQDGTGGIFVGASGTILVSQYGDISTSF